MEEKDICPNCCLNDEVLCDKLTDKIVDMAVSKLNEIRVAANDRNGVLRHRLYK